MDPMVCSSLTSPASLAPMDARVSAPVRFLEPGDLFSARRSSKLCIAEALLNEQRATTLATVRKTELTVEAASLERLFEPSQQQAAVPLASRLVLRQFHVALADAKPGEDF